MGNIFSGVAAAKTSERGAFCNPGQYLVRVKRTLTKRTRKGYDAFILEFGIEKSNYAKLKEEAIKAYGDRPYDFDALDKRLPNKEGSSASWFQSLQDQDIGFGSLKGFASSILGVSPDNEEFLEQVEEFLSEAVNSQALDGVILPLEVILIQTKKGADFSLYKWGKMVEEKAGTKP